MKLRNQHSLILLAAAVAVASPAAAQFVRYPDPVNDPLVIGLEQFSAKHGGWSDINTHPRMLGDVNGDGKADIVGFGESSVWVALAVNGPNSGRFKLDNVWYKTSQVFGAPAAWLNTHFSRGSGWTTQDNFPRMVGDVNGDGKADLVGCGKEGVYVALSTGNSFAAPSKWTDGYSPESGGWTSFDTYPRMLGDVNGDKKMDLIGFGLKGTSVSLSTGSSFGRSVEVLKNFAVEAGEWLNYDRYPRTVVDVNGDGRADLVGFGNSGVFVSLNQGGTSFTEPALWAAGFVEASGGWTSQRQFPRFVADVNKDGRADIVGFGQEEVAVSLSTGTGFAAAVAWSARMTNQEGWTNNHEMPRMLGDFVGNGLPGLVGFSPLGVRIVKNHEGKMFEQLDTGEVPPPAETFCWKDNYTRGAGVLGNACAAGYEEWGGDCYPKCPAGMTGNGPLCWQNCPAGFADMGVSCVKPKSTSSAGYGWRFGDAAFDYDTGPRARCEADHGAGKCYRSGLIWYPSCPANFHKVGDLVCSPDCPAGMRDDGAFCAKQTKERGAGVGKQCGNGMVSDAGLCYPACTPAFDGAGPVCWAKCSGTYGYNCGAGCATDQATCFANAALMTVHTANAFGSILNFIVGGPGITAAAKAAAKGAMRGAVKGAAMKMTYQWGSRRAMTWNYARDGAVRTFLKTYLGNQISETRNLMWNVTQRVNKPVVLNHLNNAANESGASTADNGIGLEILEALDITGITTAVLSFTRYASCGVEPITALTRTVDMGNIGSSEGGQTVTIKVNKPTTFLHVGTPGYSNCRIIPSTTCSSGKTFQPGESCTVTVKAQTGGNKLLGELRIYTEDLNVIPYPIQVTANSGAAGECTAAGKELDEAANLTNVFGAWAWNNDMTKKITISADGTVTPVGGWAAPGTVTVQDPNQRTFLFKFGAVGAAGEVRTLSEGSDTLTAGNLVSTKRPWHPRCAPGMDFRNNSCWEIPIGKDLYVRPGRTPMGVYSDPCPAGYLDDPAGDRCWPRWNGKWVWGQDADYPAMITDCSMRTCPENFTKNACTCTANTISKPTQTANWHSTVN